VACLGGLARREDRRSARHLYYLRELQAELKLERVEEACLGTSCAACGALELSRKLDVDRRRARSSGRDRATRGFGFAYGTLPGHVERGEERFLVEIADDDSVRYDILAFSQPKHLLTKIGYPFVRRLQKRFGRESSAAMVRAVAGE